MDHEQQKNVLSQIDKEIREIHALCMADELDELIRAARAMTTGKMKPRWDKSRLRRLSKILLAAAVLIIIFSSDIVSRRMCMYGRLLLIALLPYWDWRPYHYLPCLVENPLYKEPTLTSSDCQLCEDLLQIHRVESVSPEAVLDKYIRNFIPLVVSGTIRDWPVLNDSFAIDDITRRYLEDPVLKNAAICNYRTNFRHWSFDVFVQKHRSEDGWFAHWENCDGSGRKHIRQFYKKPDFLPPAVELTRPNWVFLSNRYSGRRPKQVTFESGSTVVWLAQARGSMEIRLVPSSVCEAICEDMEFVLETGDVLLFSPKMWSLEYLPGDDSENVAIAAGGFLQE